MSEIESHINGLKAWFQSHAVQVAESINSKGKSSDDDIERLADEVKLRIPNDLSVLLKTVDGGFQLHETFKTLSINRIIEDNEVNAVSAFWKKTYITVAQDREENYLLLECNPDGTSQNVVSWNNDEGVLEALASDLTEYVKGILDGVTAGELEYSDSNGIVEKSN